MKPSHLVIVLILTLAGCRTSEEAPDSDAKGIATQSDISKANQIAGGKRTIGNCDTEMSLGQTGNKKHLDVTINTDRVGEAGKLSKSTFRFTNHESNRSRVDVTYSNLGFGKPVRIDLERVDISSSIPAQKYHFTYSIDDGEIAQLKLTVMQGSAGNVIQEFVCK